MAEKKVAVVTGTSSGIGLHTAVGLARAGVQVVATMRDTGMAGPLLAEAAGQGVEIAVRGLDVTDRAGAVRCLDEVAEEYGPVGILVNNAGQCIAGTLEELDDAALQHMLDVNYLGVAALTRHVLPSMREAGAGRIVTVSSNGAAHGEPFLDAYCGSKFAVEGLMQSLAPVAARFGVAVSVVEPAFTATKMTENMDFSRVFGPDDPYNGLAENFARHANGLMAQAQPAAEAAAVVVEAAMTDSPRFRWQTSEAARELVGLSISDLDGGNVISAMSTWLD
ncbi:short-chain dehydrogenase [Spongiactinospora rosea]|uniref:Short-chain dehydrogenase n=1 Tax=Spongiactinospora rosea TaxID=2248750 RepID=A0A366LNW0_9ACTN|nr:SDR family NAD(P)-dependent oxidoreductase [Spongiactinospora rosea]RBQ15608.1 short-chain dehydrogenase [Spongiactinospora rosea]